MAMKPIAVSQLNSYIKRVLQTDPLLSDVSVIGEVSNLKYHGSGHVYFSLKDAESRVACFLSADQAARLSFQLAEGMEVTAAGSVSVYERGGTYSLYIRAIVVEGAGNLAAAFEALKEKLRAEGLFDARYKKPIPAHPKRILLVTSDTGAAVRDMIKVLTSRNDQVEIVLFPCLVQGPGAGKDIAQALAAANRRYPDGDVILLGRGGGSAEELWAFNEEIVARSVFLSEIPVITGIGHETDVTIADFVADLRAATPTEAAQRAVPETVAVRRQVRDLAKEVRSGMEQQLRHADLRVRQHGWDALRAGLAGRIESLSQRVERLCAELKACDPYGPMDRGYAAIEDGGGRLAGSAAAFRPGDSLTVIFKDGKLNCYVNEIWRDGHGPESSRRSEF